MIFAATPVLNDFSVLTVFGLMPSRIGLFVA